MTLATRFVEQNTIRHQNAPGESAFVARGEQNSVFRAFRYSPEEITWL